MKVIIYIFTIMSVLLLPFAILSIVDTINFETISLLFISLSGIAVGVYNIKDMKQNG